VVLHVLRSADFFHLGLWWPPVFRYGRIDSCAAQIMVSRSRCKYCVAGKANESRVELFPNDLGRRRTDRRRSPGCRLRNSPSAAFARLQRRNPRQLFKYAPAAIESCARAGPVEQRTHDSGHRVAQPAVGSTLRVQHELHAATSELFRNCCHLATTRYQSGHSFDFISIRETAGPLNRGSLMQEVEEQSSTGFSPEQILDIARRRPFHFLVPLFVGWIAVWSASWFLPPRYKSGTLILVEQQTMPKDYVTPNVNDDLQERLQSITQQILSRTRLLHIIDKLNLYATPGNPNQDDKIERMRKDIDISLVRDGSDHITAFNVYYSSRDPYTAQQVTSELTNLFINENQDIRIAQSEGTTKFLADQLEAARKNLADQEEKVREFKGQHIGELPGQLGSNLQILAGFQNQLQAETEAVTASKQQHAYLQTLLDQYRALQESPKAADGSSLVLPAIDEELDKEKAALADLSSR